MVQIFIKGKDCSVGCKVINVDVESVDQLKENSIIELDNRAWGGGISKYQILHVDKEKQEIQVGYNQTKIHKAYPTCNDKIYS